MKKFLLKMVLFILILTFCQATAYVFIKKPFPPFNQMLISSANHKTDIAFLSDSSAFWVANEDEDQSNTVEMLQRNLSAVTVVAFMYPAFDLNTYKYIVEYIARNIQCRAIVMSVNLRSFSAQWDKNPMHEFRNEKMVMHYGQNYLFRIFYKPLAVFKFFQKKQTEYHYNNAYVRRGGKIVGRIRDFRRSYEDTSNKTDFFKEKFILYYMYSLEENHRKVRALKEIDQIGKRHGIKMLFYLTPIDYQDGLKYVGPDFITQLDANVQLLLRVADKNDITLINLSKGLGPESFYWQRDERVKHHPNEHVADEGRQFIADQLSRRIKMFSF